MHAYAKLRREAASLSIAQLHQLRDARPPPDNSPLNRSRIWLFAAALLRFNFDLGDMWKWLGGPYTNAHRNWGDLHTLISQISEIPPSNGDPIPDYDLAFRACTKGVPLKGHLISDLASCRL
jgi:hypothetical protein